jgi:homopolymeric O-antigen transport system ATP-binding protein
MDPAIIVDNVSKTFRRFHPERPATIQEAVAKGLRRMRTVERFWGLRDVSFTVGAGKAVGIVGSNGSGKSTLLRLVGGVGRPDTGKISARGRIGALLDLGAGFHPDLTGRENAILSGIFNGLTRKEVLGRLDSIVAFAEVEKAFDNPMRTFSSGMQMRLAFSVAVHTEPEVLLIDEVLSVGDIRFQSKCLDRISQFKGAGCAILLVSHEGAMVRQFCEEAIWLNSGELVDQGDAAGVVDRYAAYMASGGKTALSEATGVEPDGYPSAGPDPIVVRTNRGAEVVIDAKRFGTMELQIVNVRVLDTRGQPIAEIVSGEAIQIEIRFTATERLVAPIFRSRILRDDGLVCYDFTTENSTLSLSAIEGAGGIVLHIDRLDLNSGSYLVDAGCYAQDWAYAYDYQFSACSLTVRETGVKNAVLHVPHRWESKAELPLTS